MGAANALGGIGGSLSQYGLLSSLFGQGGGGSNPFAGLFSGGLKSSNAMGQYG
jgi:hypothetical protein